ncbi:MAG: alpha-galactosidase, partial [Candidatus Hydrogenedentes bacterium]|nr:alpha-galactosidase [Candidatus Hydrogenedentota bacterium]
FSLRVDGVPVRTLEGEAPRFRDIEHHLEFEYSITDPPNSATLEMILEVTNTGTEDSGVIEALFPLDVVFPVAGPRCTLRHVLGDLNSEQSFAPVHEDLPNGMAAPFVIAPVGGRSSDEQMPYFNLNTGNCGVLIAIGWAGQWEARFQRVDEGHVRVTCGQQDFRVRLKPGERVRTPRIVLQFWESDDPVRGNNLFRQWMLAHNLPRRNGELVLAPICGSVVHEEPDGSYEPAHINVMQPLAQRGFEVFWSDMDPQQWYPIGFPDGTGTWEPDPVKYPNGLKPIGEAAHAAGLQYLLWFEPERVVRGTRIEQEHPEWVTYLSDSKNKNGLFRFDIAEAREWLTNYIDQQISAANLDWIRWDFNMRPLEYWRQVDTPERQGMTEMRHVEGLYAMWQELMRRHPGLVVDICASGGRRLDFETLKYGLPLWHSDRQCFGPDPEADQVQNGGLFPWIPLHGCGNFGVEPSYLFRSGMTTGNILVLDTYALIQGADPQTEEAIRKTIAIYKKLRPYMLGDFYELFPHSAAKDAWYGYQFHRDDLGSGLAVIYRREQCPEKTICTLRGLALDSKYRIFYEDSLETGELDTSKGMAIEVSIPTTPGAIFIYYRKAAK